MQPEAWIVEGLGLEFVELLVFVFGDVVFVLQPDRADGEGSVAVSVRKRARIES